MFGFYLLSFWPNFFYRYIVKKTSLEKVYFILSFDCDIEDDMNLLPKLLGDLSGIGIRPSLMIPTEILLMQKEYTKELIDKGYEFVNHGHRIHTDRKGYIYTSIFDYEKLSISQIKEDIVTADSVFKYSFGYKSNGFRTPHFGNVQNKNTLNFIHRTLAELGYRFSSSTIPYFLYRRGIYDASGITEIPLSGTYNIPLKILDSYNYFDQLTGIFDGESYKAEISKLIKVYTQRDNGLINLYVDPSHVNGNKDFFESMKLLRENLESIDYINLVYKVTNG
jgi:hypothetical protein